MIGNLELILRLLLSAAIGGLIGMEREANNRPAGFRTHILVTIGSALIMLISTQGFNGMEYRSDPARLAAQVVSGIGFLGAGTILRTGNDIKGLTTAASLWVCGGLGLAIGGGYYLGGLATAIIAYLSLAFLGKVEKKIINKKYKVAILLCRERPGLIGDLGQAFGRYNIMIKDIQITRDEVEYQYADVLGNSNISIEYGLIELEFSLMFDREFDHRDFNSAISKIEGVEQIRWLD